MELTLEALRLGMSMANIRAEVASTNIANANVAGYRMQRVDFAQTLGLLDQAAARPGMASGRLSEITQEELLGAVKHDSVGTPSLDSQVADLETAGTDYQALSTIASRRFALMQLAISGRS